MSSRRIGEAMLGHSDHDVVILDNPPLPRGRSGLRTEATGSRAASRNGTKEPCSPGSGVQESDRQAEGVVRGVSASEVNRMDSLSTAQAGIQKSLDDLRLETAEVHEDVKRLLALSAPPTTEGWRARLPTSRSRQRVSPLLQDSPSATRAVDTTPAVVTVALGSVKNSMRKSMTLFEIGRNEGTSALLPTGWPGSVTVRHELEAVQAPLESSGISDILANIMIGHSSNSVLPAPMSVKTIKRRLRVSLPVLHPHSRLRLSFDTCSVLVLMYELVLVPFMLSWDQDYLNSSFLPISTAITTTFWVVDILLSFMTSYYRAADGEVETKINKIAKNYVQTFFFLDLIAVLGDLLNLIIAALAHREGDVRTSVSWLLRLAKLSRFARLLGLMRLVRFIAIFDHLMESQISEAWRLLARIFEMSFALLWFAHFIACLWHVLGEHSFGNTTGESWIDTPMGFDGVRYEDHSILYQYATSYHWAMAQITLGAHDLNPVNTMERLFTVLVNIFGLIFGGTLVSILSASLIDFREINRVKKAKVRSLRHFLRHHEVNLSVTADVLRQMAVRSHQADVAVSASEVPAISLLSAKVRSDLYHALFGPHLLTLPLFRMWQHMQTDCLRQLCNQAMDFMVLLAEDELFCTGEKAAAAYFVISGTLTYMEERRPVTSRGVKVGKESWLSEPALWMHWVHVGDACAKVPVKLLALPPDAVMNAVQKNNLIRSFTVEYGKLFHRCVAESPPHQLPNDIEVPHAKFGELVSAMPLDFQVLAGLAALDVTLESKGRRKLEKALIDIDQLEVEVRSGARLVLLDENDELQMVVRSTSMRVERYGSILTCVGVLSPESGVWEPCCTLPWGTAGPSQLHTDSVRSLIKQQLPVLKGYVKIQGERLFMSISPAREGYPKEVTYETHYEIPARDTLVNRLDQFSHRPFSLHSICRDMVALVEKQMQLGQVFDTQGARESLSSFVLDPNIIVIRNMALMWLPEEVLLSLQSGHASQDIFTRIVATLDDVGDLSEMPFIEQSSLVSGATGTGEGKAGENGGATDGCATNGSGASGSDAVHRDGLTFVQL